MLRIFFILSIFASVSHATPQMNQFLKSCAYGTLGGAVIGLGTLAISDNPGGKMNNIARGASLGLYAGIGYGFYSLEKNKNQTMDQHPDLGSQGAVYFSPIVSRQSVEGVQLNWLSAKF